MHRQSLVGIVVAGVVVTLAGCARTDAPPGPGGPTLSLVGASGVSADLRRTVTEIAGGVESVVSAVDTTVWAPLDDEGTARASADAGIPGAVSWLDPTDESEWTKSGSFVDTAGVVHELFLIGKGRGIERMVYRRQGVTAIEYAGTWADVSGGSVRQSEAMTFHAGGAPMLRVDVTGNRIQVAAASPVQQLLAVGAQVTDLFRPQPLAAQFHFKECTKEWLGWMGGALLAEVAWARFLRTKSLKDLKLALAATTAAGVALDKLVDCMLMQPEQPISG